MSNINYDALDNAFQVAFETSINAGNSVGVASRAGVRAVVAAYRHQQRAAGTIEIMEHRVQYASDLIQMAGLGDRSAPVQGLIDDLNAALRAARE